jgi:hypothetical protein
LSNPYKPRELGQLEIPGFSTYLHPLDEGFLLAIPINIYNQAGYFTGALVFRVSTQSGFELLGGVDHSDLARAAECPQWYTDEKSRRYDEYRWWVQMRRSVFIEDFLYTFSSVGLSVNKLTSPSIQLTSLVFQTE